MIKFEGLFSRKSPVNFFNDTNSPIGWTVVSHRWVTEKKERRNTHGRWHKISSDNGSIYRILRYSVNLKGSNKTNNGEIVLDWIGWIDLYGREEEVNEPLNLKIKTVKWWEIIFCGFSHPDPSYRLATLLAVISVGLGVLSVVIAFFL